MSAPATPPALTFHNADFTYPGTHSPSLTKVTGTLAPGEGLALIGPNGAGKTTLLKGILGQLKHTGTVEILGCAPGHTPKGSIGYVPQLADVDASFPVTVFDVVAMGLIATRSPFKKLSRSQRARIDDAIAHVDLAGKAKTRFGKLSGGQRQRVLLARAIAAQPRLVLLDEPFNGLDHPNREALVNIINDMKKDGVAVVASTHDVSLAEETAEKVALLAGTQIAFGPMDEALSPTNVATAYGGRQHEDVMRISQGTGAH
ncbi:metal ABC transporter ATP-binding protein [Corynebacterium aquilae]|uniref:ABC transporter domain-containing protein n=1 Tax=Corynebacterium aquilae DSM 44791 TaxID=1431546 RepID=A0A1L7CE58_9CORY|nr:metal ABC transporter ATP-binding protein [Corynebacterium aquilae]APT84115.1 hypothetical protein CAQU_02425 [Corynebacterium aquilae DSM 44791]